MNQCPLWHHSGQTLDAWLTWSKKWKKANWMHIIVRKHWWTLRMLSCMTRDLEGGRYVTNNTEFVWQKKEKHDLKTSWLPRMNGVTLSAAQTGNVTLCCCFRNPFVIAKVQETAIYQTAAGMRKCSAEVRTSFIRFNPIMHICMRHSAPHSQLPAPQTTLAIIPAVLGFDWLFHTYMHGWNDELSIFHWSLNVPFKDVDCRHFGISKFQVSPTKLVLLLRFCLF